MSSTIIIPFLAKIEKDGTPILFFPDWYANHGMVVCYVRVGQHSEASVKYARSLKNAPEGTWESLFKEWSDIPTGDDNIYVFKRYKRMQNRHLRRAWDMRKKDW